MQTKNAPKIVFLHGLKPALVDKIVTTNTFDTPVITLDRDASPEAQMEAASDADFMIIYRARVPDEVFRRAKKLRLVQLLAAGYDDLNVGLLRELSITCASNGGANSWAVADQTVLLMLALYRRLVLADGEVRRGEWNKGIDGLNTFELANKIVGVIGLGNIGKQVARRVLAFDATVHYYGRKQLPKSDEETLSVKYQDLDELIRSADVLTLHAPLTESTRHLITRERLATMKPSAILINTSRGALVDEIALTHALQEGRLAGAGLDAFEKEPIDTASPLLKCKNVVLSPHSGGTTADTWVRRGQFAFENIGRVWAGLEAKSLVGS